MEQPKQENKNKFDINLVANKIDKEIEKRSFKNIEERNQFIYAEIIKETKEFERQKIESNKFRKLLEKGSNYYDNIDNSLEKTIAGKALKVVTSVSLITVASIQTGELFTGIDNPMTRRLVSRAGLATLFNVLLPSKYGEQARKWVSNVFTKNKTQEQVVQEQLVPEPTSPDQTEIQKILNRGKEWMKENANLKNALILSGIGMSFLLSGLIAGSVTTGLLFLRKYVTQIREFIDKEALEKTENPNNKAELEKKFNINKLAEEIERISNEYTTIIKKQKRLRIYDKIVNLGSQVASGSITQITSDFEYPTEHDTEIAEIKTETQEGPKYQEVEKSNISDEDYKKSGYEKDGNGKWVYIGEDDNDGIPEKDKFPTIEKTEGIASAYEEINNNPKNINTVGETEISDEDYKKSGYEKDGNGKWVYIGEDDNGGIVKETNLKNINTVGETEISDEDYKKSGYEKDGNGKWVYIGEDDNGGIGKETNLKNINEEKTEAGIRIVKDEDQTAQDSTKTENPANKSQEIKGDQKIAQDSTRVENQGEKIAEEETTKKGEEKEGENEKTDDKTKDENQTEKKEVEKVNENAIVRKGEGITHAFLKQLKNDDELCKQLGIDGDKLDNPKYAAQVTRDLAIKTGYIDDEGHEIRVSQANKVAYELKFENDKIIVDEKYLDGNTIETHIQGDDSSKFEIKTNDNIEKDYEYSEDKKYSYGGKDTSISQNGDNFDPERIQKLSDQGNDEVGDGNPEMTGGDEKGIEKINENNLNQENPTKGTEDMRLLELFNMNKTNMTEEQIAFSQMLREKYANAVKINPEIAKFMEEHRNMKVGEAEKLFDDTINGKSNIDTTPTENKIGGKEIGENQNVEKNDGFYDLKDVAKDNGYNFSDVKLKEIQDTYKDSIKKIFPDLEEWKDMEENSARRFLNIDEDKLKTQEEFSLLNFMHKIKEETGIKPQRVGGWFGHRETNAEFLLRGMLEAEKRGILDKIVEDLKENPEIKTDYENYGPYQSKTAPVDDFKDYKPSNNGENSTNDNKTPKEETNDDLYKNYGPSQKKN